MLNSTRTNSDRLLVSFLLSLLFLSTTVSSKTCMSSTYFPLYFGDGVTSDVTITAFDQGEPNRDVMFGGSIDGDTFLGMFEVYNTAEDASRVKWLWKYD